MDWNKIFEELSKAADFGRKIFTILVIAFSLKWLF